MQANQLTTYTRGDLMISSPDEAVVLKLATLAIGVAAAPVASSIPAIGAYWPGQGGVNAGLMRGEDGQPDYWLIVPDVKAPKFAWGGYDTESEGCNSRRDGLANTIALVNDDIEHMAAQWCAGLDIDGHSDLYLPAISELALCMQTFLSCSTRSGTGAARSAPPTAHSACSSLVAFRATTSRTTSSVSAPSADCLFDPSLIAFDLRARQPDANGPISPW